MAACARQAGLEPRKLFNVVEFMMYDKDGSAKVSFEDCMEILYRRHGKEALEERTNAFFSADLARDNEVSFAEFQEQMFTMALNRLNARQSSGKTPRAGAQPRRRA